MLANERVALKSQIEALIDEPTKIIQLLRAKGAITVKEDRISPGSGQPVVEDHELFNICTVCKCDCTVSHQELNTLKAAKGWDTRNGGNTTTAIIREYYQALNLPYRFNKAELIVVSNMVKRYGESQVRAFLDWLSRVHRVTTLIKAPNYWNEFVEVKSCE